MNPDRNYLFKVSVYVKGPSRRRLWDYAVEFTRARKMSMSDLIFMALESYFRLEKVG